VDDEPSPLYDRLALTVSNVRIEDLDTVTDPSSVLQPTDRNILFNPITLNSDGPTKHLNLAMTVSIAIGGAESPLRM
jgi:hypothetical protein